MSQFKDIDKNDLYILRQAIRTYRHYFKFDYSDSIGRFNTKRMDEMADEMDELLVGYHDEIKRLHDERWNDVMSRKA